MDSEVLSALVIIDGRTHCLFRGERKLRECGNDDLKLHGNYSFLMGVYPEPAKGEAVFNMTFGPVAGGLFESIKFNIRTYGERILSVTPEWNCKARRITLSMEPHDRALLKVERINALFSASYSSLFCHLIEKITETEAGYETQMIRMIMIESERIASHILAIQRLAEAASQNVAKHHLSALRERFLRVIASTFGHRYIFGMNQPGGIARSVDLEKLQSEVGIIAHEFYRIWELIKVSRVFMDRIIGVDRADRIWYVGPTLRASGHSFDARIDGWLPYSDFGFSPVIGEVGDSYARASVRAAEILESARLIGEMVSERKLFVHGVSPINFEASGSYVDTLESPGGELVMGITLNEGRILKPFIRSASWCNLPAFTEGIKGGILTDFSFGVESHGLIVSEMGDLL